MILHAEDNWAVADAVRETLELEGWKVDTYQNGASALRRIESDTPYDVLLLDYDLPRVSGLELVRRARQMAHRKRTPIIMLSASEVEADAWQAGVDAFLRKPDDVGRLAEDGRTLIVKEEVTETVGNRRHPSTLAAGRAEVQLPNGDQMREV